MKLCPKCGKQFSDDANFCPVDAARLTPLAAATPTAAPGSDSLTQRFELGDRLGGSRTGAVHRAVDKTTKQPCIVKLVAPAVVGLPGVSQRLERELKQLERVPAAGVAKVLGSGMRPSPSGTGQETWVAMELLDGAQTVAEAISARGPLGVEEAAHLIEVIGEALIEAAQVGVVHRDLSPKNVLFAGSDIKLINFSLPVPTTEKVAGVAEFVAPEQVDGKPVDQRSNLYSLGALYYYLLSGQTVHSGPPEEVLHAHQNGGIKPISQIASVPAPVETVIMRALDRSPTKRFLTVRQFVDEVSRIASGAGTTIKSTSTPAKRELVQTLLGMKSGARAIPAAAMASPSGANTMVGLGANPATTASDTEPSLERSPADTTPGTGAPGGEKSPWSAPKDDHIPAAIPAQSDAAKTPAAPVLPTSADKKTDDKAPDAKDGDGKDKGKFRETQWFKEGEVGDKGDGSITRADKEKYSLRTGGTQASTAIKSKASAGTGTSSTVSEDSLIDEMKSGRKLVLAAIAAGVIILVIIIVLATR